jgi:precorrin-6B C5,15-methyltransferase / cobalt-precorrin-6B C5,C15-methyltransferase
MNAPWLSVVGIGEDGLDGLGATARTLIDTAEVLIGGERHLAMVSDHIAEKIAWPSPMKTLIEDIERFKPRRTCILASGDPTRYGVAVRLFRRLPVDEMTVVPAPSSITLACAAMGWPQAETRVVTLHGRPLDLLNLHLHPGARLIALSENAETPAAVAGRLTELGFGDSQMAVLERLGGSNQHQIHGIARDWAHPAGDNLNIVAIACVAGPGAQVLSRVPGLPDDAYTHDGTMTKREVRAATLAALAPPPGGTLWDIGAGSGSIAIEWIRAHDDNRAFAIEPLAERRALIATNAARLGAPGIRIIDGRAPEAVRGLPTPDAIFIGGGLTTDGVVDTCWAALAPGGRMVANAVTLESERILMDTANRLGGALTRIQISRAEPIGGMHGWKPLMPVTQWIGEKSRGGDT